MADVGLASPELLIARAKMDIDFSRLVIEGKEVRLLEIDEERERLAKDTERVINEAKTIGDQLKRMKASPLETKRASLKQHEFEHVAVKNNVRLLELDDDERQVRLDIAASEAHIARLEAEASQQTARLKERDNG